MLCGNRVRFSVCVLMLKWWCGLSCIMLLLVLYRLLWLCSWCIVWLCMFFSCVLMLLVLMLLCSVCRCLVSLCSLRISGLLVKNVLSLLVVVKCLVCLVRLLRIWLVVFSIECVLCWWLFSNVCLCVLKVLISFLCLFRMLLRNCLCLLNWFFSFFSCISRCDNCLLVCLGFVDSVSVLVIDCENSVNWVVNCVMVLVELSDLWCWLVCVWVWLRWLYSIEIDLIMWVCVVVLFIFRLVISLDSMFRLDVMLCRFFNCLFSWCVVCVCCVVLFSVCRCVVSGVSVFLLVRKLLVVVLIWFCVFINLMVIVLMCVVLM